VQVLVLVYVICVVVMPGAETILSLRCSLAGSFIEWHALLDPTPSDLIHPTLSRLLPLSPSPPLILSRLVAGAAYRPTPTAPSLTTPPPSPHCVVVLQYSTLPQTIREMQAFAWGTVGNGLGAVELAADY
jgi:hypothetical protein